MESNFRHGIKYLRATSMIPPDAERMFAERMNATTISINTSQSSYVAHPDEIAQLILDAAGADRSKHKETIQSRAITGIST